MRIKGRIYYVLFLFLLFGCAPQVQQDVVVDYLPTIQALETEINDVSVEKEEIEVNYQTLIAEKNQLAEQISNYAKNTIENEEEIAALEEEITGIAIEKEKVVEKDKALQNLFIANEGDEPGEFVFCTDAFKTEFAYIDKVSMRTELSRLLASFTNVNIDSITSEHHMIWSNTDDGLIKIYAGGYMYPFIVRFDSEEFGSKNSVYSLTSGCYIDFPALEAEFLAISSE